MDIGRGVRIGRGIRFSPLTAIAEAVDEFFRQNVLLMRGNSTNDGTNNNFIDESPNALTVTRNGNTTQGSFSPFSAPEGYWGSFFSGNGSGTGSSDRLSIPNNSSLNLSNSNFTIECWVYLTNSPTVDCRILEKSISNTEMQWMMRATTRLLYFAYTTTGVSPIGFTSNSALSLNTWTHVAVTRSGNTWTMWINGVADVTYTSSDTIWSGSEPLYIGNRNSFDRTFPGYISNLRIVKGTSLYNSTFTPSTSPLTAVANTSLLICQSNRFKDNSTNNSTITVSGSVRVTSFGPFAPPSSYSIATNGGSAYFDGTGDYLTAPNNAVFDFGSGDFTIETWIYLTSTTPTETFIFGKRATNSNYAPILCGLKKSGTVYRTYFLGSTNGSTWGINSGFTNGTINIPLNTWVHVSYVRNGTTFTSYVNGVQDLQFTGISGALMTNTDAVSIGADATNGNNPFYGHISNLRVVKGTAVYTGNFTPPTEQIFSIAGTSLLLNFTNGNIIDLSSENNFETIGNARVRTDVTKFNPGSLYFDGNGDYLLSRVSNDYDVGTGNFTVECWVYPVQAKEGGIIRTSNAGSFGSFALSFTPSSTFKMLASTDGTSWAFTVFSASVSLNTWHHVAIVRNGANLTLYVNGVSQGAGTLGTSSLIGGLPLYIGWANWLTEFFNGYIDDIRFTRGVARYTTNFTPPTGPLPTK